MRMNAKDGTSMRLLVGFVCGIEQKMDEINAKTTITSIIVLLIGCIRPNIACSEHVIINEIFAKYNPDVRPVKNQSSTIVVRFRLFVYSIVNINEQQESISLLVWMKSIWKDEYLRWNLSDFGHGCTDVKTRAKKAWTPNAVFLNTLELTAIVPPDDLWLSITNEGEVTMTLSSFVTLRCSMKISDFPFDTQRCPLTMTIWTYEKKELQLSLYSPTATLTDVLSNSSEFQTMSLDVVEIDGVNENRTFSELHYTLVLKRTPEYYIFVIIIPSFLLTSLCIIGIFTPNSNIIERNERVTLGLTTLLSMAFILNIVADQMPKTKGLPLLGHFILCQIGMCTLAIVLATIVIFLHQRANTRAWNVPRLLSWMALAKPAKRNSGSRTYTEKEIAINVDLNLRMKNLEEIHEDNKKLKNNSALLITVVKIACERMQRTSAMIERKIEVQEQREIIETFWVQVFDGIDTVLLAVLLIANSVLTFTVFRYK